MQAFEIVRDRKTKEAGKEESSKVMEICKEYGLLIGKGGIGGNVLRVGPPMCVTEADIDFALNVLETTFSKL